jgi:UDP-N-acetylglucosamine 2-epimerase (non-hydrolysing)
MTPASQLKILCIAGARPNFMKIAPVVAALQTHAIEAPIIHTGQHYDPALSSNFFEQLNIPAPHRSLEVGSGSHAVQTAEVMKRFEKVVDEERPDGVLVVGDVNSTLAAALVAAKKCIPVIHVEAGLRSGDRNMPEEINRILTDRISDVLYVTERLAIDNLLHEGVPPDRIEFTGNVMVDTLLGNLSRATAPEVTLARTGLAMPNAYGLLTLHRPSNVDDRHILAGLLDAVSIVGTSLPFVFPVHPRTKYRIAEFGLSDRLENGRVLCIPPVGYLEMAGLMRSARLVMTDSGGIQEETTALGVPCLTLRENTERPITVTEGTNILVGTDPAAAIAAATDILAHGGKRGRAPELWDGRAAERIAADLSRRLTSGHLRAK